MFSKKGQGLSLNVIIIAALALIVLVVLAAVFIGRITPVGEDVERVGNTELVKMKLKYGTCHPNDAEANSFVSSFGLAGSPEDGEKVKVEFSNKISDCKEFNDDQKSCEASGGCSWK